MRKEDGMFCFLDLLQISDSWYNRLTLLLYRHFNGEESFDTGSMGVGNASSSEEGAKL